MEDENYRIAAEASFYLIFSIFPLIFLIFTGLGSLNNVLFDEKWLVQSSQLFSVYVPDLTLEIITKNLRTLSEKYRGKDILVAWILFLWPASSAFYTYIDAVSKAYRAPNNRTYLKSRALALALLFVSGFVIFLTSLLFGLIPLLLRWAEYYTVISIPATLVFTVRYLGSFLLITPCIALIYRFSPDLNNRHSLIIWPGALFATTLWLLFSQLLSFYLKYIDTYQALYGALGGAMLLLLWMYLVSLAVVLGAEFNYIWQKQAHISQIHESMNSL